MFIIMGVSGALLLPLQLVSVNLMLLIFHSMKKIVGGTLFTQTWKRLDTFGTIA